MPEPVTGIDPASWQVTVLPFPKGQTRGAVSGFCGGAAVGNVEAARRPSVGCWWPGGKPRLLTFEGRGQVTCGKSHGEMIAGSWRTDEPYAMGAIAWGPGEDGMSPRALEAPGCERSWATASAPGVVVGIGSPERTGDGYVARVGLLWKRDAPAAVIAAAADVPLLATDGTRLAGSIRGRAMLWTTATAEPRDLNPERYAMSEVRSLDGEQQAGVAFRGTRARAALWSGSAASFRDLTPDGYQTAGIWDSAQSYQVGVARVRENTKNGTGGYDDVAVLWQGDAARWIDLNALLPDRYNSSAAHVIEVSGGQLRIGGCARRFEVERGGTPHESHVLPVEHPVVWSARIDA